MHEILTIQLGHKANFVATHFWNAQEAYFTYEDNSEFASVNHDIHFRPGINTAGEETFTPRTLIYDLKGGFGGLRKWGGLYDQQLSLEDAQRLPEDSKLWDGSVLLQKDPQIAPSEYQRSLDEGEAQPKTPSLHSVRYWSDFNRVFYHPRSIVQLNEYELGSSLVPFEKWGNGEDLFAAIDRDEDILDRDVRPWVEECDQLQGLQLLASVDDAWGGFAAKYAERLRDEFGKLELWVWGIEEERGKGERARQLLRMANGARTLSDVSSQASMYIPLSPPLALPSYVQLEHNTAWHNSALLSAALETATLSSRLRPDVQRRGLLSDLSSALNLNGNQRISELQCSILDPDTAPDPSIHRQGHRDPRLAPSAREQKVSYDDEDEKRQNTKLHLDMDLSGGDLVSIPKRGQQPQKKTHVFGATTCQRGRDTGDEPNEGRDNESNRDEEEDVGFARKRARFANKPIVESYDIALPYPLPTSYPPIFPARVSSTGTLAVATSLSTTTGLSTRVRALQKLVGSSVGGFGRLVPLEERESLGNRLGEIGEAYVEGWESGGSDDSEDD